MLDGAMVAPALELPGVRLMLLRLLALLAPAPDARLLEIGCGWGQFACLAAKEAGARVTAITLSPAQLEFARRRVFAEGLAERISVELCDYRDVKGRFDRIASIEMIEAVGEEYWPVFFAKLSESLAPGGRAAGLTSRRPPRLRRPTLRRRSASGSRCGDERDRRRCRRGFVGCRARGCWRQPAAWGWRRARRGRARRGPPASR